MKVNQSPVDSPREWADSVSARVFPAVARAPQGLAPRWWNHPVAVMYATVLCAAAVFAAPVTASGVLAVLVVVGGVGLATAAEINRQRWSTSRCHAEQEAAWVAAQSGYQVAADEAGLRWLAGEQWRPVTVDHHRGWWHACLDATGASSVEDAA
ncbi:hypothetical protein [uncultured Citricoccus sp.]|uniref:hypothetical protein n=1 Tax=uncultured Citricoccus sp. TaxID=614031 RepID=UPI00261EEAD8|nr:hypothetical protein [uncultured Citricoccus sp.]